jgi:hypothetical protein
LHERRNSFVHGVWGTNPKSKSKRLELMFIKDAESKLLPRTHTYSAAEVNELADEIDELTHRPKDHLRRLGGNVP